MDLINTPTFTPKRTHNNLLNCIILFENENEISPTNFNPVAHPISSPAKIRDTLRMAVSSIYNVEQGPGWRQ